MTDRLFRLTGALMLLTFVLGSLGCGQQSAPQNTTIVPTEEVSTEPGEVELSEPLVTFTAPDTIQFEVKYRFTKGKPVKHYTCEVKFPGTTNQGSKPMESWELKPEGVIKDGITLHSPPVTTFEIVLMEADSPDEGYKKISNVVRGPVK